MGPAKQSIEVGGEFLNESDAYRVLDSWQKNNSQLISKSDGIRQQFEQVAFIYQGETRQNPLCRNPNELTSAHNLSEEFSEGFKNQHFRFFNDFIGVSQFIIKVDRCIEVQQQLVLEICSFFEGADFNFEADKTNAFLDAIEPKWPDRQYTKSALLTFFGFLENMRINDLILGRNSPIAQQICRRKSLTQHD